MQFLKNKFLDILKPCNILELFETNYFSVLRNYGYLNTSTLFSNVRWLLYSSQHSDADEYADLFSRGDPRRLLEIHAPLRTGRRRCSGQHDTNVLSDEAVEVKRHRRRLERRYRRTGLPSDKRAYKAACNAARTSIMTSRADHIRTQLQQASGNIRATWRTAQSLLLVPAPERATATAVSPSRDRVRGTVFLLNSEHQMLGWTCSDANWRFFV